MTPDPFKLNTPQIAASILSANFAKLGAEIVGPRLQEFSEKYPNVGETRGVGMFWALELVRDKETREPLAPYGGSSPEVAEIVGKLKAGGVLPFNNFHRLHVVPPLNISADGLNAGLDVFEQVLSEAHYT